MLGEPPADLDVRLVAPDHEALVQEPVDLLVDRCDDWREAVPDVLAGNPAGKVEVDTAVGSLDLRSLRPHDHEPRRRDAACDVPLPLLEEIDRPALPSVRAMPDSPVARVRGARRASERPHANSVVSHTQY